VDRNVASRSRARQLLKDGQLEKAINAFEEFLTEGDAGPYDYVYMGDLLVKAGRPGVAIRRYEEAIAAYSQLGFYRNAVALARKILRLDPERLSAYRRMGDLYASEELVGDALHAYFTYLDRAADEERATDGFREAVQCVSELAPRRAEFAIRHSEYLRRLERPEAAAQVLEEALQIAQQSGAVDVVPDLRDRLAEIDPQRSPQAAVSAAEAERSAPDAEREYEIPSSDAALETGSEAVREEERASPAEPPEIGSAPDPIHYGEIDLSDAAAAEPHEAGDAGEARDEEAKAPVAAEGFESQYSRSVEVMEAGDPEGALALLQIAVEMAEDEEQRTRVGVARGRCLTAVDRHAEAVDALEGVLKSSVLKDERAAEALWLLAASHEACGEIDEAQRRLHDLLALQPDHSAARALRDRLEEEAA